MTVPTGPYDPADPADPADPEPADAGELPDPPEPVELDPADPADPAHPADPEPADAGELPDPPEPVELEPADPELDYSGPDLTSTLLVRLGIMSPAQAHVTQTQGDLLNCCPQGPTTPSNIACCIRHVAQALATGSIDHKRANTLLYALQSCLAAVRLAPPQPTPPLLTAQFTNDQVNDQDGTCEYIPTENPTTCASAATAAQFTRNSPKAKRAAATPTRARPHSRPAPAPNSGRRKPTPGNSPRKPKPRKGHHDK